MAAECFRENPRQDGGDKAVDVGNACAHRDQGEHVQAAIHQRLPAANEKWPASPQHYGRCERALDVIRKFRIDPVVGAENVRAHFHRENRDRQDETDPESAHHVDELGVGAGIAARDVRLKRHATDGAGTGADLTDLRMHRAGVDRAVRHHLRLAVAEIFLGINGELRPAARRTEIVGVAALLGAVLGRVRINRHAADGIDDPVVMVMF
jgi:hypothetical protein